MKTLKELTPDSYRMCGIGLCPAVFQTADGTYLLIGKLRDNSSVPEGRVGDDEVVIEIPTGLLADICTK